MNSLSRVNLFSRIRNLLLRSVQSNLYSTKFTHTIEKSQHLIDSRTKESSESSSSFSDRIKEQVVRPKPTEIPYQGKVANSVNLIGYVNSSVRFEADSNGNHFAATVISQDSLLIPVVFEGDLAHVVAYHVKENNHVLVSGRLSDDPTRFVLSDSDWNLHIVADNLNFVERFKRKLSAKPRVSFSDVGFVKRGGGNGRIEESTKMADNDDGEFNRQWKERKFAVKPRVSFSDVGFVKRGGGNERIEESMKMADNDDDEFSRQWKEALEGAKVKRWGENLESKSEESTKMADNDDDNKFIQQWKEALEEAKVKRWGDTLESKPE